jgi:hypothetical protein
VSENRPNIWRLQALADTQGLIKALEHSDPDIRERAAIALRTISAFDSIPAMRQVLTKEDNPDVRTIVTSALVHLLEEQQEETEGDKPASPPDETTILVGQLKSNDPNDIIHACQALGALGDSLAVEPLVMLFNNGAMPANVRLAAAEALIELKSPPTVVTALVALRRTDGHLRRIAAAMLGHLQADWAIEPLRAALKDDNELVRRTARAALKHINTPEALQAAESVPEHEPSMAETPSAATPSPTTPITEAPQRTVDTKPAEIALQPASSSETTAPQPVPEAASSEAKPAEVAEQPVPSVQAAPAVSSDEPAPEKPALAAASKSESTAAEPAAPDAQPKPEWSLEQTRPTRPEGLDAALQAQTAASPVESTPATPSSDGASPEAQSTPQTNA